MSKLSILIGTYGTQENPQNQEYLDMCLRSLEAQVFKDFDINIVSSGTYKPEIKTKLPQRHAHFNEQTHYPKAVSLAYEMSNIASEYILFLNDDVILHKDCLNTLILTLETMNPLKVILNPLCNSDSFGHFYVARTGFVKKDNALYEFNKPQFKAHELKEHVDEIISGLLVYPFALINIPFNALYCTILRRDLYEELGKINSNFLTGNDDLELSIRAQKSGVRTMTAMHASAFHFGGISADVFLTEENKRFNDELLNKILSESGETLSITQQ